MSYVFDQTVRMFRERFAPRSGDSFETNLFEMILQEMHSANHAMNDAINRNSSVSRAVREYEDYINDPKRIPRITLPEERTEGHEDD